MKFENITVFEGPEKSPGFLLWHVSTTWRSRIEKTLKTLGLTHPQFVVLASLGWLTKGGERVTQAAVGKLAGLDPNTMSQIFKGLEKKHLIERKPSTDTRAKNPLLTKKGEQIVKKALPLVEQEDRAFFQNLTKSEEKTLIRSFHKIVVESKP